MSTQQVHGTSALKLDTRIADRRYRRAIQFLQLNLSVIPIPNGQKHPNYKWGAFKGFQLHALYDDFERLPKRLRSKGRESLWLLYSQHDGLAIVTGMPSDDLFIIDCDSIAAGQYVLAKLRVRGIDAPYVETARGIHIYLKSNNGTVASIASGIIPDIEIKSDGQLAIAPPTVHPSGVKYTWANGFPDEIPCIDIDELDFFEDSAGKAVQLKPIATERFFHADTIDYLSNGHKLAEGTRNDRLYDAARDFRYCGKPAIEAERILAPIAIASGLSRNDAISTIHSPYKNTPKSDSTKRDSIQSKLWAYAQTITFESVKQVTGLAMIEGLLSRRAEDSHNRHNGIFRASYRELETKAKVSHRTCQKTLDCLVSMGIIERAGNVDSNPRKACLWRFTDAFLNDASEYSKSSQYQKYHSSIYDTTTAVYCATFNTPLAERGALGKRGHQVYSLLSEHGEMSVKEIMQALDISKGSVVYQLGKLKKLRLIQHDSPMYRVADDYIAIQQVLKKGILREAKQRQRIQAERALWALVNIVPFILSMPSSKQSKTIQLANYSVPQNNKTNLPKSANSAHSGSADTYTSTTDNSVEFTPNSIDSDTLEAMYRDMSIDSYVSDSIGLYEDET